MNEISNPRVHLQTLNNKTRNIYYLEGPASVLPLLLA